MSVQEKTRVESTGPADPLIGREIGGFRIESVLGRGGMGVVYKATQHSLGRAVAIKVLPAKFGDNPQFVERFRREVDVLSRLSHPNIVTVFERGDIDGAPYVAMEYVEGTTLREVMRNGPLPRGEALLLVRSILSALEHAHGKGIIHRDIKPENVLVAPGGIVKVADFGLGRLMGPADATRLTHTHLMLGTFEYMAPEQRERAKEADERADLYATGVMLYEMIAGELPIGVFAPLSEKRPRECDRRIDQVVRRSLEKDPEQRYQRASQMGEDVSRLLTHAPLDAPPPAGALPPPPLPPAGTLARAGAWVTALLRSWPVARITGKVGRRFARDLLEEREVQLWLRRAVPGLWETFPSGVEFEKDAGRIVMKLDATIFPQPGVPQRLASAFARVLEARAPDQLRSIASADSEWEAAQPVAPVPPPSTATPAARGPCRRGAYARYGWCALATPLAALWWAATHSFRLTGSEWVLWSCATAAGMFLLPLLLGTLGRWGWALLAIAAPAFWFMTEREDHRIQLAAFSAHLPENLLIRLMAEPQVDAYIREHAPIWPGWPRGMKVRQDSFTVEVTIPASHTSESRAHEVAAVLSRVLQMRAPVAVTRRVFGDASLERRLAANPVPGGTVAVER